MSDEQMNLRQPQGNAIPYEPPTVRPLGNVRDLLAGNGGTQPDADPDLPSQPSG